MGAGLGDGGLGVNRAVWRACVGGIDRVTVYRRVGSKDDVIQAVIAREARRLIAHVTAATAAMPTFDELIATGFTTAVGQVRENALFNRMLALEADTLLPRLTTHATPLLATAIAAAVGLIEQAQEDGLVAAAVDPAPSAEILIRIVHSFVLTPQGALTLRTDDDLRAFARTHLAPIVTRNTNAMPSTN